MTDTNNEEVELANQMMIIDLIYSHTVIRSFGVLFEGKTFDTITEKDWFDASMGYHHWIRGRKYA